MKSKEEIINEWYELIEEGGEKFLDFAEGLNINEFVIEKDEKVIWLEDGNHYIAHGTDIRENDNQKAKEIIKTLEEYGIEFKERK